MRGHIYKRSIDSWTVVYDTGRDPVTGRRRQVSKAVRGTKKDAERELRRTLNQIDSGMYVAQSRFTVSEFLEAWLTEYVEPNLSAKTRIRYESIVQQHLIPAFGHIRLRSLRPRHVSPQYARWADSGRKNEEQGGLSPRTIVNHHRVLKGALGYAVQQQVLAANPADSVKPPRVAPPNIKVLDRPQLGHLLEIAKSTSIGPIVHLAGHTGMRQGEVLAVRWSDVNLDNGTLRVERALEYIPGEGIRFKTPKTARSRRTVTLSNSLVRALRRARAAQAQRRLSMGEGYGDQDLVFATQTGRPLSPRNVLREFGKLVDRAGIPKIRFHDLRHTYATILLNEGVPISVVSERLGHSTPTTTLNVYAHVLPNVQQALADKLDAILGDEQATA